MEIPACRSQATQQGHQDFQAGDEVAHFALAFQALLTWLFFVTTAIVALPVTFIATARNVLH